MRSSRSIYRTIGASIALSLCAITASYVFAQELSSTNFQVSQGGLTELGGYSTTSSFSAFESSSSDGSGESESESFMLDGGFESFADATPLRTQNWRWYDDSFSTTPTDPLAAENTAPSAVPYDDGIKLRITVSNTSATAVNNLKLRLQYSTSSDFSEGVEYVAEQGECGTVAAWCYINGGGTNNGLISDAVLSDAQSCSGGAGVGCGTYNESGTTTSSFIHTANRNKEYDFAIQQTTAEQSTVYFFRLVDRATATPIPPNTGETYPSLTVDGGTLTFSIGGLSSGESTEGVTTDIATSPSAVSFGSLQFDEPRIAAHRLIVTTSASSGYKVFTFQRQGLVGNSGEIDPVNATNDSPLGWSLGCAENAAGCYGYHAGKDVLEGGSTRFAADDSFARFTQVPTEVAYGIGPVDADETDIIYKVAVTGEQESGEYAGAIVYIVTPVF